jgi:hypothetical protein
MARQFAQVTLKVLSPLHIGSGRAGMLAKSHSFVPAHVVTYALAAAIGKANGGQYENFVAALETLKKSVWCGAFFLENPAQQGTVLLPSKDKAEIERQFLFATNHVTLLPESRASVEGALFEVEKISACVMRSDFQKQPTRLIGGVWFDDAQPYGRALRDWFNECLLGGEIKTGCGRVLVENWQIGVTNYAGHGEVFADGLHIKSGETVLGVALNGVQNVSQLPWTGRLYDKQKGFGRKLSDVAFVYTDGVCERDSVFLPNQNEVGLGCWVS